MNTMGNLVQGIILGDGAVAAYLDLAVNKRCGTGLFHGTTKGGYRKFNFVNNYPRMSSYYNIQRKLADKPTNSKRYFFGNLVSAHNVDRIPIGWSYTTDANFNTLSRGYTSSADFDNFQRLLRDEQLFNADGNDESNYTLMKYISPSDTSKIMVTPYNKEDSGIQPLNRGDLYQDRPENFRRNHKLLSEQNEYKEKLEKENIYKNSEGNKYHYIFKPFYTEFGTPITRKLSLYEIAEKEKPYDIFQNDAIKKYWGKDKSRNSHFDTSTDSFGELFKLDDDNFLKIFTYTGKNNVDLLKYYENDRNQQFKHLKGTPFFYTPNTPYTQEWGGDVEIYKIGEKNTYTGTTIVDDNRGILKKYDYNTLNTQYSHFDEKEEGYKGIINTNLSQGSSVIIDNTQFDSDNTSRLLRRTNDLFRAGRINSLINRFHTNTTKETGINDELFSSRSQHGISRGRNLLKRQYSKTTTGDKSSGYDNPYCRVWTAHHQYAKLKDRIRPFVDENGNYLGLESLHNNFGEGLRPNSAGSRLRERSVLQDDGFVKITPYTDEYNEKGLPNFDKTKIMNYMFSIENLAWKDILTNSTTDALSPEQKGPNNGRIMWFPPYNLKFTENVNVNWNGNSFIGRGEQIYTYTNTERAGTLSFTLLIDHPSVLNTWRGTTGDLTGSELKDNEETMLRFFAGCEPLDGKVIAGEGEDNKETPNKEIQDNKTPEPTSKKRKIAYVVFFPNNYSGYDDIKNIDIVKAIENLSTYETSSDGKSWNDNKEWLPNDNHKPDESYKDQVLLESNKINYNKYGLNKGLIDENEIKQILLGSNDETIELKFLVSENLNGESLININRQDDGNTIFGEQKTNSKITDIEIYGFASSHGYEKSNRQLVKRRSDFMYKILTDYCDFYDSSIPVRFCTTDDENYNKGIIEVNKTDGRGNVNAFDAKVARAAILIFNVEKKVNSVPVNITTDTGLTTVNGYELDKKDIIKSANTIFTQTVMRNSDNNIYRHDTEYLYFSKLAEDATMLKNIVNRVRHFDPAYHSITPEGFNARLTFLHQCTRQGPTVSVNNGLVNDASKDYLKYAGNLSFGRAPYCILRIGDFFHTKILIDSISIDYDNGGGTQWDLNPEGVGVQPMLANININFKFVGGQDLSGPIERLQNAVTSNYYANASIYDKNADYDNVRKDLMIE